MDSCRVPHALVAQRKGVVDGRLTNCGWTHVRSLVQLMGAPRMTFAYVFAVLFLCASASDVLEYTDAIFEDSIKFHEIALVKFYAPW
ncbi:hypothetical protein DICVIV_03927 [Dictyocaulus viviparus]|uniref:Uncharacterized protein n=1 Tax=Dictyocaulus viviparus TaxID=29172 RepID=A0A0D8XZ24_DICVI|nr:hypothetical protein DICVIV_03927 [Dictyocaulus viviparus]